MAVVVAVVAWSQELSMNYMAVPQHLFDGPTSPKPKKDPKPNKIKASTSTSTSTSTKSSSPAIGTVCASSLSMAHFLLTHRTQHVARGDTHTAHRTHRCADQGFAGGEATAQESDL